MRPESKQEVHRRVLAARTAADPGDRAAGDDRRTAALLARPAVGVVAAYVATGTEPATAGLLASLAARGATVLLPRLRTDGGLDLVRDDGSRVPGRRGTVEPAGPASALVPDLWLVPALAVDRSGVRLGRGGGAYDRSLPPGAVAIALLHAGELVDALPAEPHDRRVAAAALPDGVVDLGG